jgi:hypothetical protein
MRTAQSPHRDSHDLPNRLRVSLPSVAPMLIPRAMMARHEGSPAHAIVISVTERSPT